MLWAVPDERRAEQIADVLQAPARLRPTRLFTSACLIEAVVVPGRGGALVSTGSKVALYEDDTQAWGLIEADALMLLAKLPDACVDAIVTDPPYGIALGGEAGTAAHSPSGRCKA